MLKDYFRLFEECYLVQGINKGSIYNLLNGHIYDIDNQEQILLNLLEKNHSISEVINTHNIEKSFIQKTLDIIKKENLGNYFDKPIYIEKTVRYPFWREYLFAKEAPTLTGAFINIKNKCDKACEYCKHETIRKYSCLTCHKDNNISKKMDKKDVFKVLEYLKRMNCHEIYFTGGNIFLDNKRTIEILKYAKQLGFKSIKVIYGGDKLDKNIIDILTDLKISIITQIYLNKKQDLYSRDILDQLEIYKYKLSKEILILLDDFYLDEKDFKYLYKKVLPVNIYLDKLYNNRELEKNNKLSLTSIPKFSLNKRYNLCLYGKIYISYDGKIFPCPGLRDFKVGHISNFHAVFSEEGLYKYWNLNKDMIEKCSQCSHRYACNDCRSMEYKLTNDLYGLATCDG